MAGAASGQKQDVAERDLRRDAAENRDRILAIAAVAVRRAGPGVPMATIAAQAGVGVGTVYRHYPSREALLSALTQRSFRLVLGAAERAAAQPGPAIEAVRSFLNDTIEHGPDLVLPLHGGPAPTDAATVSIRREVHRVLGSVIDRGHRDATLRADATTADIVIFGALLAQALPQVPNWAATARRQAAIYVDGLETSPGPAGPA
jgi:AcrR family transcriptional regulator